MPTGRRPGPGLERVGGVPPRADVRREHGSVKRVALEPQQVAEVGERVTGVGELPVEAGRSPRGCRVDQQVLGVEVAVHQAGPAPTVSSRACASTATSRSPVSSSGDQPSRGSASSTEAGSPSRSGSKLPIVSRPSTNGPGTASACRRGRPGARRGRRRAARSASSRLGAAARAARPAGTTSRAGRAGRRRVGAAYLQDLGDRQQARHQPSSAASTSWAAAPRWLGRA